MTVSLSFPPPSVRPRPTRKKFYRSVSEYTIITHVGTHMDAPIHYFPEGKTIDAFPLEKFIGEGVILDVPKRPLELIDAPDLEQSGLVREGDIVMLCTGWGRKWPSPEYHEHPYLTEAAAHWLVRKKVKLIGIDFPAVDLPQARRDENYNNPVHHVLLSQEVLIIENLADMSAIAGKRAYGLHRGGPPQAQRGRRRAGEAGGPRLVLTALRHGPARATRAAAVEAALRVTGTRGEPHLSRIDCEHPEYPSAPCASRRVEVRGASRGGREDRIRIMIPAGVGLCSMPEYPAVHPGTRIRPVVDPEGSLVSVRGRRVPPAEQAFDAALQRRAMNRLRAGLGHERRCCRCVS